MKCSSLLDVTKVTFMYSLFFLILPFLLLSRIPEILTEVFSIGQLLILSAIAFFFTFTLLFNKGVRNSALSNNSNLFSFAKFFHGFYNPFISRKSKLMNFYKTVFN